MAQIKIYGRKDQIHSLKARLSDAIHACVVEALKVPTEKRFHRFFLLDADEFYYAPDRSEKYIIIEINMIAGRTLETIAFPFSIVQLFRTILEPLSRAKRRAQCKCPFFSGRLCVGLIHALCL